MSLACGSGAPTHDLPSVVNVRGGAVVTAQRTEFHHPFALSPKESMRCPRGGMELSNHISIVIDAARFAVKSRESPKISHPIFFGPPEGMVFARGGFALSDNLSAVIDVGRMTIGPAQRSLLCRTSARREPLRNRDNLSRVWGGTTCNHVLFASHFHEYSGL